MLPWWWKTSNLCTLKCNYLQNTRERKLMITAYVCLIHIFPARRFRIVAFLIPPKVIIISIILQQQLLLLLLLLLFPASPTSSPHGLVLHMTALDHSGWAALLVPLIFVLRRNAEKLHVRFILVSDRRSNHHRFSSHLRSGKSRRSTSRRRCYRFITRRLSLRRRSGCSRRNSRRRIIRRTLVTHLPSSLLFQSPLQKLLFLIDLAHRAPTPFHSSFSSLQFPFPTNKRLHTMLRLRLQRHRARNAKPNSNLLVGKPSKETGTLSKWVSGWVDWFIDRPQNWATWWGTLSGNWERELKVLSSN